MFGSKSIYCKYESTFKEKRSTIINVTKVPSKILESTTLFLYSFFDVILGPLPNIDTSNVIIN